MMPPDGQDRQIGGARRQIRRLTWAGFAGRTSRQKISLKKDTQMSLSVNTPDKILAGVHQSHTITSDEGAPSGSVSVGGSEVAHRIIRLGAPKDAAESTTSVMKYKVTFLIPDGSVGKTLQLKFSAGGSQVDESHEVIAE